MAVKTFSFKNIAVGSNRALQEAGAAIAAATTATGWVPGTTAPTQFSRMLAGTERANNTFGASSTLDAATGPGSTSCWQTELRYGGVFASGNWTISPQFRAVTAGGAQDGRIRMRVWASVNRDGSGARELTTATLVGATITDLATSANQTSGITWAAPQITLNDEYLFFDCEWEITGAGSGSTQDVDFRTGTATGCTIATTDYTDAYTTIFSNALGTSDTNANTSIRCELPVSGPSLGAIRVTFKASNSALGVTHAGAAKASGTAGDLAAAPGELLFDGAAGFSIAALGFIVSDWLPLDFTGADLLAIMQDTTSPGGTPNGAVTGSYWQMKASVPHWSDTTFASPDQSSTNLVFSIFKIETKALATAITATALTVGAPTIGTPAIALNVDTLAAANLTLAAPVVVGSIPAFGIAGGAGVDTLSASGLTTGAPTFGAPALQQTHGLAAAALAAGVPTFGAAALAQTHLLAASALTDDVPTFGTPPIVQNHVFAATALSAGAPVLDTPAIYQSGVLACTSLAAGTPTLGSPALCQQHNLAATSLVTGAPTLGAPALTVEAIAITAAALTDDAPLFGTPTIKQAHRLLASALATGIPILGAPILVPPGVMIGASLAAGTPVLGTPTISQRHVIAASGLTAPAPTLGPASLVQGHNLTAAALSDAAPTFATPAIGQRHNLVAAALTAGAPTFTSPQLGQKHKLIAAALTGAVPVLGTPLCLQPGDFAALSTSAGAPTLGAPQLNQAHRLAASSLVDGAPTIAQTGIGQAHRLTAAELMIAEPAVGSGSFAQIHQLLAELVAAGAPEFLLPVMQIRIAGVYYADDLVGMPPLFSSPLLSLNHPWRSRTELRGEVSRNASPLRAELNKVDALLG